MAVAAITVTSISATTVRCGAVAYRRAGWGALGRRRSLSAPCAAASTRRAAQAAAYAGSAAQLGRGAALGLGGRAGSLGAGDTDRVVVDAGTGKVLMRYEGFVSAEEEIVRVTAAPRPSRPFAAIFDASWRDRARRRDLPLERQAAARRLLRHRRWSATSPSSATARQDPRGGGRAHQRARSPVLHRFERLNGKLVGVQTVIANSSDPIGSDYSTTGSIITLQTADARQQRRLRRTRSGHRRDFRRGRVPRRRPRAGRRGPAGLATCSPTTSITTRELFEDSASTPRRQAKTTAACGHLVGGQCRPARLCCPTPTCMRQNCCAADRYGRVRQREPTSVTPTTCVVDEVGHERGGRRTQLTLLLRRCCCPRSSTDVRALGSPQRSL